MPACRGQWQEIFRDYKESADVSPVQSVISRLQENLEKLDPEEDLEKLRGLEGDSAEAYFSVFSNLILSQDPAFRFSGRNRRPPLDAVNAMLSFVYTLLYHDMISALECTGLDPAAGFLHRDRPGRLSLALDLMEEFRAFFADRLVLSLINRNEISGGQFEKSAFFPEKSFKNALNMAGKGVMFLIVIAPQYCAGAF